MKFPLIFGLGIGLEEIGERVNFFFFFLLKMIPKGEIFKGYSLGKAFHKSTATLNFTNWAVLKGKLKQFISPFLTVHIKIITKAFKNTAWYWWEHNLKNLKMCMQTKTSTFSLKKVFTVLQH